MIRGEVRVREGSHSWSGLSSEEEPGQAGQLTKEPTLERSVGLRQSPGVVGLLWSVQKIGEGLAEFTN